MDGRKLLIYLSKKFNGNYKDILDFIVQKKDVDEKEVEEVYRSITCKVTTLIDEDFPEALKRINPPIFVLYYYGDLSLAKQERNNLAVIGSREASEYGKRMTQNIIHDLGNKYNIVSGLARGIDACAHDACILNKGKTIAVLGSGINYCYPLKNKKLYDKIKTEGLILSEYPDDYPPKQESFPLRNRIIAGLSRAVLITEAKIHSGTMITVNFALQAGKDVLCVPYLAGENSGCNHLIKEGAILVENAEDIIYELGEI